MITVNIHEAKTNLSKLIAKVEEKGERVQICRDGKLVAELCPPIMGKKNPLELHPQLSKIKIMYDPTEPITEEEWPSEFR